MQTGDQDFDRFWIEYPRRTSKISAIKAYKFARKTGATADEILAGLARFCRELPERRFIPYPSSWLRAGGWMDEDDHPSRNRAQNSAPIEGRELRSDCVHEPRCPSTAWHRVQCEKDRQHKGE